MVLTANGHPVNIKMGDPLDEDKTIRSVTDLVPENDHAEWISEETYLLAVFMGVKHNDRPINALTYTPRSNAGPGAKKPKFATLVSRYKRLFLFADVTSPYGKMFYMWSKKLPPIQLDFLVRIGKMGLDLLL